MQYNQTKNQHFISQIEQRLNCINPNQTDKKKKIYSFYINDPIRESLQIDTPSLLSIKSNLSLEDLFSFHVDKKAQKRLNFENLFSKYESTLKKNTYSLIYKLRNNNGNNIKSEIIQIFSAKLLNFLRNPYCVEKIINTFGTGLTYRPTDPDLNSYYEKILIGTKPHQNYLCHQIGISHIKYTEWLCLIFNMLSTMRNGNYEICLFDSIINSLFCSPDIHVNVSVYFSRNTNCLLSDRGFTSLIPENTPHTSLAFNLCGKSFIHYTFTGLREYAKEKNIPDAIINSLQHFRTEISTPLISTTYRENDIQTTAIYNKRVIEQCHRNVYCCVKSNIPIAKMI